jgi:adenylate cyclase class 2
MTEERELKFEYSDLSGLRERLEQAEADRVSASSLEDNLIFDRDGELEASGRLLRLRQDGHGAYLTYKGPPRFEGGLKVRVEEESAVEDAGRVRGILEGLGYELVQRYQKYREEWRLGGVSVCLDHTPIGDYVEFEGEGAEKLARRFGFSPESAEKRNYLQIYQDYRRADPSVPEKMVFP